MAKITIPNITSSFASVTQLNAYFQQLEDELNNKVLYRNNPGGEPNTMVSDLDMNSKSILNGGAINATTIIIGGSDLTASVTAAAGSATAAAASAATAATGATTSTTQAALAAAAFDDFDDRELGSKASAPTLDNDGDALVEGAQYWNSVTKKKYIWNGSAWQLNTANASDVASTPAGTLAATDVQAALNELDTEKLATGAKATDSELLDGVDGAVFARKDQANTFTEDVTIHDSGASTEVVLNADTGFDSSLQLKENNVLRAELQYDESADQLRIRKFDTDGSTVKSEVDFKNSGDIDVVTGTLKQGSVAVAVTTLTVDQDSDTGAANLPVGTTAQRPGSPAAGMMRRNTTTSEFEGYTGAAWASVGGSSVSATETAEGIAELATQAETNAGSDDARIVTPLKLNKSQQTAASWVVFTGVGTPTIFDSYNVSSITDNGTGDYDINFDTDHSDALYFVMGSAKGQDGAATNQRFISPGPRATTDVQILVTRAGGTTSPLEDSIAVSVGTFGAI